MQDAWRIDDLKERQRQESAGLPIIGFGGDNPYQNVDLDTMHLDLYKGFYHSPDSFLEEITWIEQNAEVEGDKESIVKAGQMTNHARIMLDSTFEPQFKTDCAKMAERMVEREAVLSARAGKAAAVPAATSATVPVALVEPNGVDGTHKRDRAEAGDEVDGEAGPSKRLRGLVEGEEYAAVDGAIVDDSENTQPAEEQYHSAVHQLSYAALGPTSSAVDFLAASSLAASSSLARILDGSPAVVANGHFSGSTVASTSAAPVPTPLTASTFAEQDRLRTPEPSTSVQPAAASPIAVDPSTPEPLPDFVLEPSTLAALKTLLVDETQALNVDQLEQLRASCYDGIWRSRKEWDRTQLVADLTALANEFIDEVQELREYEQSMVE